MAVGVLAEWAALRSRPLLTFSTDYVFDGAADRPYVESSSTNPINAYGRSKLLGESLAVGHGALVVRTSWVISGSHPNFVATILRKVREQELRVVDDQRGNPTVAADLARASYAALQVWGVRAAPSHEPGGDDVVRAGQDQCRARRSRPLQGHAV